MKHNLVPANRDETVLIREDSTHLIHVRLSRTDYDPNNPERNRSSSIISVFRPEEFEKFEKMKRDKISVDWVRAAGFTKAYVVHDGRLEKKKVEQTPVSDAPAFDEAVKAEVKKIISAEVTKKRRVAGMKKAFAPDTAK